MENIQTNSALIGTAGVLLAALAPATALASGAGGVSILGYLNLKIPTVNLPPPERCRLWYPNRTPDQQPAPALCAYLVATAPPNVVVIDHAGRIVLDRRNDQQDPPDSGSPGGSPTTPGNSRFVDNGDGTVTDKQTGLMWEMKLAADGTGGGNCADPDQANRDLHCANNIYTWTDGADGDNSNPDGTVFAQFLSTLNQDATDHPDSDCYASHCDWRIPRLPELRTILIEQASCYTPPCADAALGPTAAAFHWSATSGITNPGAVWGANFGAGTVTGAVKDSSRSVRAVRGGR